MWYNGFNEVAIESCGVRAMNATIDQEGRIALGQEVQNQLGVQPGDDVLLENRGDEWVIKAAKPATGLCREGNVLVHRGIALPAAAEEAEFLEDTGPIHIAPRISSMVIAQVVSVQRKPISVSVED
jgi:bifunctional DNA-binding transcriptional regulator/antitoxin component of YhaV-PrlF toxin-antitoxin module